MAKRYVQTRDAHPYAAYVSKQNLGRSVGPSEPSATTDLQSELVSRHRGGSLTSRHRGGSLISRHRGGSTYATEVVSDPEWLNLVTSLILTDVTILLNRYWLGSSPPCRCPTLT